MRPTPGYRHLDPDKVYDPSEDTFLLLDAIELEEAFLKSLSPAICLEIGTGSGIVITHLANILGQYSTFYMATDINPHAAECAKLTADNNRIANIDIILADLTLNFSPVLIGQVDVLLFNPPYVVTPSTEVGINDISASWAGGLDGREVLDRMLPHISTILSVDGVFYIVATPENNIDEIAVLLCNQGLRMNKILSRRAGREHLTVLKFMK